VKRLCLTLLVTIGLGGVANAVEPATQPTAASPATQAAAPAAAGDLSFDLFDDGAKPADGKAQDPAAAAAAAAKEAARVAEVEKTGKIRRAMLVTHQALGFTTLAVVAATVAVGQVNYLARYNSFHNGNDYERFQPAHLGLGISSAVLFAALGTLGWAAPNPYPKPIRFDTAMIHKIAMSLATAGMVTQMVLGPLTTWKEGSLQQRDMALGHLVVGYATWGFMATGVIAYVF
jgi:hypothetical protein